MTARALVLPRPSLRFLHVWRRNRLVWRKLAIPSMLGNLADPMLYMLGLGYGLGAMISGMLPGFPAAYVPWWAALLSFGFAAGVGIVFGILPAAKAANLDPIEALRYE